MCKIYASQPPESYAFETRSLRLNGQCTSIRLEKIFWTVLESIACSESVSLSRFISKLHAEILLLHGEVLNFTSHLRCICLIFVETKLSAPNVLDNPVMAQNALKTAMRSNRITPLSSQI